MAKLLKKHAFLLHLERHFTSESTDAFELIHFEEPEQGESAFEAPENWSIESTAALSGEAGAPSIPASTRSKEENTVPSWLWRRTADGKARVRENSVRQIFHRIVGTATYAGWKKGVFADEAEARIFFDETRYMLAQRFIAIDPRFLATAGLDWAYGLDEKPCHASSRTKTKSGHAIRNASIDALLSGDASARQKWQKTLDIGAKTGFLTLSFADISTDWNGAPCNEIALRTALDMLAFQRDDGVIAVERILHATRLLTVLLELLGHSCIAIGLNNLAPLLMSQALAYDSEAGRTTAAALAAAVTAEACATSAQLAGLLGPSLDFAANRESVLRTLRNHRRAAYGDRSDYEKVSVLPVPLELGPGIDLALIASTRRRWDEALEFVQQHGLRFAYFTDFSAAQPLAFFMESLTQGTNPMPSLTVASSGDGEIYHRVLHVAIGDGLAKLGYNSDARKAITIHIAGAGTLEKAPHINHASLRRLGFDAETQQKIEQYLPLVNDIRLAFTSWIVGEEFMRDKLKIDASKAEDPRFGLLRHLGFANAEIDAANVYCYGTGGIREAKGLKAEHASIFAAAEDISAAAQIRMAASVQGFISGDAGLCIAMPEGANAADSEQLLLDAWRQGVKSIAIEWDVPDAVKAEAHPAIPAPPNAQPKQQYTAPLRSTLRSRSKASGELVGLKGEAAKSGKKTGPNKNS